jgi:hypothetical protein
VSLLPNPPLDFKRDRRLAAILFACSLAALLVPHAWPSALKFTTLAAGGFVATLLFPPLLGRLRISAKHAPALGAGAIVLSVFLLFGFIESRIDFPVAGVPAFVIGMAGFATIMFADHLRSLSQGVPR